jgi:hypothetical protein
MRKSKALAWVLVAAVTAGCASGGGGGGGGDDSARTSWSKSLGRITYPVLLSGADRIFQKYNFAIYRQREQFATIYMETDWNVRKPFADEAAQGVTEARTRFLLNGRRSDGPVFSTVIEAENQVRTSVDHEWREAPITDQFVKYVRGIVMDLEAEVRTGIR